MSLLLNLLFPKSCLECGQSGAYICRKCVKKVQLASFVCPFCKRFSPTGATHLSCRGKTHLDGLVTIWRYQGVVRKAILALKYRFAFTVVSEIVENISPMLLKKNFSGFVVISVPLSRGRLNWRGFNQADLIANSLSKKLNLPYNPGVLKRIKYTPTQVSLGKKERLRNTYGIFAVNPSYCSQFTDHYSRVLVVDDVYTTGATLNEIARVLKKNGAKEVWGMTVAR